MILSHCAHTFRRPTTTRVSGACRSAIHKFKSSTAVSDGVRTVLPSIEVSGIILNRGDSEQEKFSPCVCRAEARDFHGAGEVKLLEDDASHHGDYCVETLVAVKIDLAVST